MSRYQNSQHQEKLNQSHQTRQTNHIDHINHIDLDPNKLPEPYRCFTGLSSSPQNLEDFYQDLAPVRRHLGGKVGDTRRSGAAGDLQEKEKGSKIRWTPILDLHITLEFFQGLSLIDLDRACRALDSLNPGTIESSDTPLPGAALRPRLATNSLQVTFDKLILLPSARKPRVLALGISNPRTIDTLTMFRHRFLTSFASLRSDISDRYESDVNLKSQSPLSQGFQETGSNQYLPHLTLGRFRPVDAPSPELLKGIDMAGLHLDLEISCAQLYLSFAGKPPAQRPAFEALLTQSSRMGAQYPVIHGVELS